MGNDQTCPKCGGELTVQYDTTSEEEFWHCWDCDTSFDIGLLNECTHFTSVPTGPVVKAKPIKGG